VFGSTNEGKDNGCCFAVTADCKPKSGSWFGADEYFPELLLSQWMRKEMKREVPVYTFVRK
jgi:hypothetical protein